MSFLPKTIFKAACCRGSLIEVMHSASAQAHCAWCARTCTGSPRRRGHSSMLPKDHDLEDLGAHTQTHNFGSPFPGSAAKALDPQARNYGSECECLGKHSKSHKGSPQAPNSNCSACRHCCRTCCCTNANEGLGPQPQVPSRVAQGHLLLSSPELLGAQSLSDVHEAFSCRRHEETLAVSFSWSYCPASALCCPGWPARRSA